MNTNMNPDANANANANANAGAGAGAGAGANTSTDTKDDGNVDTSTAPKRLFLAAHLSIATTRRISDVASELRRATASRLRAVWVPPPSMHITLKFLGWAKPEATAAIRDVVARGIRDQQPFEVIARGVGAFPNPRSARVLWAGIDDSSGDLDRLATGVEQWMEELGFPREQRSFSPHVTIARIKEGGGLEEFLPAYQSIDFGRSAIREVVLYESKLRPKGSEYLVIARIPLAGTTSNKDERQTRELVVNSVDSADSEEPNTNGGQPTT
ncbi:MAG: RNA 2',3'-cyclic phosphodiesterase [Pseudomonadota bacterium]